MLLGGSVIVLPFFAVATSACDEHSAPRPRERPEVPTAADPGDASKEPPPRLRRELAALAAEAGLVEEADPAPPSGDLKSDIDAFTTLEACVRSRSRIDPVVGDAIESLGYETLARDACRSLEALKEKDKKLCSTISLSTLRARCESNVAIVAGDPEACPFAFGAKAEGRDPECLARAAHDERLCAAVLPFQRDQCVALVTGNKERCKSSESCLRQVDRWRLLLQAPSQRTGFPARLRIALRPEKGTPEPQHSSFDLDDVAAAGAVVSVAGDRTRVTLGRPKNAFWTAWDAPAAEPKLYLAAAVRGSPKPDSDLELDAGNLTLELLLPNVGAFSAATAEHRMLRVKKWSLKMGEPLELSIDAIVSEAPRSYHVQIEVVTFVRDVVGSLTSR